MCKECCFAIYVFRGEVSALKAANFTNNLSHDHMVMLMRKHLHNKKQD